MSMYPRTNYEMTEAQLAKLLEDMRPTPAILIGGGFGPSRQENANNAWAALGAEMGFDSMTVQPDRRGDRFFTAIPSETPEQRQAREAASAEQRDYSRGYTVGRAKRKRDGVDNNRIRKENAAWMRLFSAVAPFAFQQDTWGRGAKPINALSDRAKLAGEFADELLAVAMKKGRLA